MLGAFRMKKNTLEENIVRGLVKFYEGQIAVAYANIEIYIKNPAGIGEHSEVLQAIDAEVAKYAEAEEKLEVLSRIVSRW